MRRGMTLFEMLMVLVIVVGLLAIGVPGLVIVNNGQRVNNAANSLAAALSQARARAIFDKRPHGIRLIATDPDNPESNKPSPQWFDTIEFVYLRSQRRATQSMNFPIRATVMAFPGGSL
jgi:prepilin-type N-terminal cleavage/methylation domain-containing protein